MAELRNEIKLPETDGGVIPLMKSNLFPSFFYLTKPPEFLVKLIKER